jgi:Protein of unknown function (DUF1186)/SEC-C motif
VSAVAGAADNARKFQGPTKGAAREKPDESWEVYMDVDAILNELTHAQGLPRAALAEAAARRAEIVPIFLKEIEGYLAASSEERANPNPIFFIFHLLGDWSEKSAYRPLARLLRCPPDELDAILGYGITTTTHRVMAAVFDGDPQPLFDIVLDPMADEFARSRMCEVIPMLVMRGELDRDLAARFLLGGFEQLEPRDECFVWQGWQSAIAMLGLSELRGLVKRAFDRGYISRQWLGFHHFEKELRDAAEHPGQQKWLEDEEFTLFGDTVEELSTWYCFTDKDKEDRESWQPRTEDIEDIWPLPDLDLPHVNPFKGIGRNDPCPCGSGKKFKKCCLQ